MAIKDYWIFQSRECPKPWALYVVKEYDKRMSKDALCLDITYYHEDICNSQHMESEVNAHYETVDGYASHIAEVLGRWSNVNDIDMRQLRHELLKII